jgi:hypothetical protein
VHGAADYQGVLAPATTESRVAARGRAGPGRAPVLLCDPDDRILFGTSVSTYSASSQASIKNLGVKQSKACLRQNEKPGSKP